MPCVFKLSVMITIIIIDKMQFVNGFFEKKLKILKKISPSKK